MESESEVTKLWRAAVRDEQPHAIILRNGATTERPPWGGRPIF